jgi:RimJ/RimL family protein N-acetyltransferase
MPFHLQPTLQNDCVQIRPLKVTDFETLFALANDPLVWEQHPNKNRYLQPEFENYFKGAIESGGAFLIADTSTGKAIGSSRYYDWSPAESAIAIGYTFLTRSHWGGSFNPSLKALMLQHAFQYVDTVLFHVGVCNIRSQRAMEKLGATKLKEIEIAYYGEAVHTNIVYKIEKQTWESNLPPNS